MGKEKQEKLKRIYFLLKKEYPHAETFLHYTTPFQLLVAVILSAQTTDAQVNKVTPELFKEYRTPADLMTAEKKDIESIIFSTGFYKVKAKNIMGAAEAVSARFGGVVPKDMESLLTISGVGRKSANVVKAHCFNKPAVIVDTHFARVTGRLGLPERKSPAIIEKDIAGICDVDVQTDFSMIINVHGRKRCFAKNPDCGHCVVSSLCFFPQDN